MDFTIKKILTPFNFTYGNSIQRIKYIVIHYFGYLGSAESVANYFFSAPRGASAHYVLDEGSVIFQCVEDMNIAWHCGTKRTYFHPDCRNHNSIGIEVRPYKINKQRSNHSEDSDWYFTDETINNLIMFVKYLMNKHNIDIDNVIRHYDVTHKQCPRPYTGDDINTYYKVTGNTMWSRFKNRLIEEGDDMDGKEIFDRLMAYLNTLPTSDYAIEASKKGIKSKIFADGNKDGLVDNPRAFVTREQLVVVLNNAKLLDK